MKSQGTGFDQNSSPWRRKMRVIGVKEKNPFRNLRSALKDSAKWYAAALLISAIDAVVMAAYFSHLRARELAHSKPISLTRCEAK
jgi:hypothetical protein